MSFQLTTDTQLIFNFFTVPGWIAVGVSLVAFALFFILFENPKFSPALNDQSFSIARSKSLLFQCGVLCSLQLIVSFALIRFVIFLIHRVGVEICRNLYTGIANIHLVPPCFPIHHCVCAYAGSIYSELFGMAIGEYRMLSTGSDLWKCYISVSIAAGAAFLLWRHTIVRVLYTSSMLYFLQCA